MNTYNQMREIHYCHSYVHLSPQLKSMIFRKILLLAFFTNQKYITRVQPDWLPFGLTAQLIEDRTGIAEVRVTNKAAVHAVVELRHGWWRNNSSFLRTRPLHSHRSIRPFKNHTKWSNNRELILPQLLFIWGPTKWRIRMVCREQRWLRIPSNRYGSRVFSLCCGNTRNAVDISEKLHIVLFYWW